MSGWTNTQPLSLTVGTVPGQHIIIVNPATGDALDVYDANNRLVYSIKADGSATSFDTTGTIFAQAAGGRFTVQSLSDETSMQMGNAAGPSGHAGMIMTVVPAAGALGEWDFLAGSADGTSGATLFGTERAVRGSVVQSDQLGVNNLTRTALYTATVVGAAGAATFNHNCGFTPKAAQFTPLTNFSQGNWTDAFGTHGFTATQAQVTAYLPAGGFVAAGQVITLYGTFYG